MVSRCTVNPPRERRPTANAGPAPRPTQRGAAAGLSGPLPLGGCVCARLRDVGEGRGSELMGNCRIAQLR